MTDSTSKKQAAKKKPSAKKTAASASASKKKAVAKKTDSKKATTAKAGSNTAKKAAAKKTTASNKTTSAAVATDGAVLANDSTTENKLAKSAVKGMAEEVVDIDPADVDQDDDLDTSDLPNKLTKAPVPYERGSGHYMDTEQLTHFSKKLADWKQQLMEEVDRTVGHMKDDATNHPDPNDRATQEEEFSLELRTRDRERKLIKKINEAQKRIDDDEYGYCETCGIEIGVNRLEARPTAELCIDCKTLEEIRERQTA